MGLHAARLSGMQKMLSIKGQLMQHGAHEGVQSSGWRRNSFSGSNPNEAKEQWNNNRL